MSHTGFGGAKVGACSPPTPSRSGPGMSARGEILRRNDRSPEAKKIYTENRLSKSIMKIEGRSPNGCRSEEKKEVNTGHPSIQKKTHRSESIGPDGRKNGGTASMTLIVDS